MVLGNIENSLSAAHIAAILKRYGAYPTQISFLDLKKDLKLEHVALIHFRTVSEAKTLHSRLYKEEESSHLGALLHRIPGSTQNSNIRWLNYRALDPDYN